MRIVLSALSLVLLLAVLPIHRADGDTPLPAAMSTLERSGAPLWRAEISVYGNIPTPAHAAWADVRLGREMARALGFRGDLRTRLTGPTIRVTVRDGATSLVLETVAITPQIRETVYAVDEVTKHSPGERTLLRLAAPLQRMGLHPQLAVDLVGHATGDLRPRARSLLQEIFRGPGSVEATGITAGPAWSVAGLVPEGGPPVLVSGREVNLQVAISYDRGSGASRIIVGAPVISISY